MEEISSTVRKALKSVGPYPEYQQIINYLTATGYVPPAVPADLPEGVAGAHVTPGFTDPQYKAPVVEMDRFSTAMNSPRDVAATLIHEYTHAAQAAMRKQAKDGGSQFKDGYQKLYAGPKGTRERDGPLPTLAKRLDASWEDRRSDYRSTPHELQAFGVGNSVTKKPNMGSPVPGHLDATAATEFMILLDLALRDQAAKKK